MESFYTVQGEGAYTGAAAYFIRLGGCDVGCFWCDVKESWDADVHPKIEVDQLVKEAKESGTEIVVITGGEPAMHNLDELTKKLRAEGLRTHIETSGAHKLTGEWDWVCLSPKKFKAPLEEVYSQTHELKVVVYNKHDFQWAEEHREKVNDSCGLFLQPEWDRADHAVPMILNYLREHPEWRISLQTHKYIGVP
ncbi:7-carboxy-7-deazaguanine synthase QueE [Halocola ammonii]